VHLQLGALRTQQHQPVLPFGGGRLQLAQSLLVLRRHLQQPQHLGGGVVVGVGDAVTTAFARALELDA
jgi:hypothetical protein